MSPAVPYGPTAAVLTPGGRGAVATIRVSAPLTEFSTDAAAQAFHAGLDALFHAANGKTLQQQTVFRIAFGQWGEQSREDLVVCRLSVDEWEIHCHGGDQAVRRILDDLHQAGCAIVDSFDQPHGGRTRLDLECLDVASRTTTWRTTRIALEQSQGLLRAAIQQLAQAPTLAAAHEAAERLLKWERFGRHLTIPWSVVLTGRPNVGKSSLINALLGFQRAIVFDEPGTTRDVVTGETALDGWPILLSDTAGLRSATGELEAAGIALALERLQSADLRLLLIDQSTPPIPDDERLLNTWPDALIVAHKSDQPDRWHDQLPADALRVSSVTGTGLPELRRTIVVRLIPHVPLSGTPIPITSRQIEFLQQIRDATSLHECHTQAMKLI